MQQSETGANHSRANDQKRTAVPKAEASRESSLKGTFISVLVLGGFIAAMWAGVFALYLSRN